MINLTSVLVFLGVTYFSAAALVWLISRRNARAAIRRRLRECRPHGAEPSKLPPHKAAAARARLFDDNAFEQAKRHGGSLHFVNRSAA